MPRQADSDTHGHVGTQRQMFTSSQDPRDMCIDAYRFTQAPLGRSKRPGIRRYTLHPCTNAALTQVLTCQHTCLAPYVHAITCTQSRIHSSQHTPPKVTQETHSWKHPPGRPLHYTYTNMHACMHSHAHTTSDTSKLIALKHKYPPQAHGHAQRETNTQL